MAPAARRRYQEVWLRGLIALAWERAPGVRKRMEAAGWIVRDVTKEFPPSTRYALTVVGRRFKAIVANLANGIA